MRRLVVVVAILLKDSMRAAVMKWEILPKVTTNLLLIWGMFYKRLKALAKRW